MGKNGFLAGHSWLRAPRPTQQPEKGGCFGGTQENAYLHCGAPGDFSLVGFSQSSVHPAVLGAMGPGDPHGWSLGACAVQGFSACAPVSWGWWYWALDGPVPAQAHTGDFGAMCMSSSVIVIK